MIATSDTATTNTHPDPDDYAGFLASIRARFATFTGPLFTTDAEGLWEAFLDALPPEQRQHHTCNACRRFVESYGGLVAIKESGRTVPAMWNTTTSPELYVLPVAKVYAIVARAKVTGVHLSSETTWGQPVTGAWRHMAVTPTVVYRGTAIKNAGQAAAEKREDYAMLQRGLAEFPADAVTQAHTALTNGALYRSEKCIGPAKWLMDLHAARDAAKGQDAKNNVVWLAVAAAPAGFCHVRTTMISTLLEDIVAGLPFPEIKAKFDAKMAPLAYMRPVAPPKAGNLAEAERIVASLQSAGALARRFARIEDVVPIWTPAPAKESGEGGPVFGHLAAQAPKSAPSVALPPVTMTWEKFARTILRDAARIDHLVGTGNFYAFTAAENPDAPPILQWDREEQRNTVAWYTYPGGSSAHQWSLRDAQWAEVTAVSAFPFSFYGGTFPHQGEGTMFLLAGCKDSQNTSAAIFPECLRAEYHGIRATIEAYSKSARLSGQPEATACGVAIRKGQTYRLQLRVTPKTGPVVTYLLDRWD